MDQMFPVSPRGATRRFNCALPLASIVVFRISRPIPSSGDSVVSHIEPDLNRCQQVPNREFKLILVAEVFLILPYC